jgi:hypothetical protein
LEKFKDSILQFDNISWPGQEHNVIIPNSTVETEHHYLPVMPQISISSVHILVRKELQIQQSMWAMGAGQVIYEMKQICPCVLVF